MFQEISKPWDFAEIQRMKNPAQKKKLFSRTSPKSRLRLLAGGENKNRPYRFGIFHIYIWRNMTRNRASQSTKIKIEFSITTAYEVSTIRTYQSGISFSFQSYTEICQKPYGNEPTEPFQGVIWNRRHSFNLLVI